MAYEMKSVPSSGKGSSISVSGAFCQGDEGQCMSKRRQPLRFRCARDGLTAQR